MLREVVIDLGHQVAARVQLPLTLAFGSHGNQAMKHCLNRKWNTSHSTLWLRGLLQIILINMVKSDPDSVMLALSKGLGTLKNKVFKITFKRGGIFNTQHTKAHSRKAKQALK